MNAFKSETFTVTHQDNQYHYTLYYYDQAGNLEKTVPPAAITPTWRSTWLDSVKTDRAAGTVLVPGYSLITSYRYNTLNQVVAQLSPDGGQSSFWYDRLGRLAISQNAKQNPNAEYSYTQYDSIGRIYQVGELTNSTAMSAATSRNAASLLTWLNGVSSTMEQITQTVYDYEYSPLEPELYAQNLRNRVAYTSYYALQSDISSSTPTQATTTYYSYDILGNVDTLVQDYHYGVMNSTNNRFKKIVYNYDLQSGKVDQVAYQHGSADAFYHTYSYDAENRLTNVQTSADSINWDNDAFYSYYLHGPLARTVLGDQQVQGLNYAYTLQGWMKAINPPVYSATGYNLTKDGSSGTPVRSNAYNLLLNYYQGDDSLVSGATGADVSLNVLLGGSSAYRPLYNGNISSMGVNVVALTHPLLYNYQYDQLNRIVHMDAWNNTGATWANSSILSDFEESVTYDPNGNILTYSRNGNNTFAGSPLAMDNLTYNYTTGTNKLDHIADAVSSSNYPNDIDNQSSGNYSYDAIGELTADNASSITGITWTVYGKINTISKSGGISISFTYDAAGNRISKSYNNGSTTIVTWYVRDAQGNVLSVYTSGDATINSGDLSQTESDLYGSSRLGMLKSSTDVYHPATVTPTTLPLLGQGYPLIFTRGNKLFELGNHLGNVLVTISDKKLGISTDGSTVDHFSPQVLDANDYYPFGSLEPGRTYAAASVGNYRYGFNGQEGDNEINGPGNAYTAVFWEYDPRSGRRWNLDPKKDVSCSPYFTFSGNPIWLTDIKGDTPTTKESADMADNIYGPGKNGVPPPLSGGWQRNDLKIPGVVYTDDKSGYSAGLYSRNINGKMEYSFVTAGTDPLSWKDWKNNLEQPLGIAPQYKLNAANAKALQNYFGDKTDLTFVGHSLGGAEAAQSSMITNHPAITFNAAGLGAITTSKSSQSFVDFVKNMAFPSLTKIDAYVVKGEILNTESTLVGLGADGKVHIINVDFFSWYNFDPSGISRHLMGAVKNAINHEGIK